MKWRAKQLMRDDLAKSSKSRLRKEFYKAETTTSAEGSASIDSSSNERLHRRNSQLRMDDFLSVPDFNRDTKQPGKPRVDTFGKSSLSDGDLTKALKCQSRVRRHKRKHLKTPKEIVETNEDRSEPESQVIKSVLKKDVECEIEKVCIKIEYEKLHEEHANYKEEIKSLKFALQRTAEEYEQLHQLNDESQREIQSLKNAQAESTVKHQKETTAKEREVETLNEQCLLAQQQIKELQTDVEQGVETLKKDLTQNMRAESKTHEMTKKRLREAESRREDAERLLKREKDRSVELQKQADELALKINQVKETSDSKSKKLLSTTKKVDGLQTKLHQREVEIRGRVEEISTLMKNETKILSTIQKQQLELESKNDNVKRLKLINKALLKQRDEQKSESKRKEEEISALKSKLEATQKYVESLKNKKGNHAIEGENEKKKKKKKAAKKNKKKGKSNHAMEMTSPLQQGVTKANEEGAQVSVKDTVDGSKSDSRLKEPTEVIHDTPSQEVVLNTNEEGAPQVSVHQPKEPAAKTEVVNTTPSQKSFTKKENVKEVLKKMKMKDGRRKNGKKQSPPASCKIPAAKWNNVRDDDNVGSSWTLWNIFFILMSFILLVSYFHVQDAQSYFHTQDIQGYFKSTTTICEQAFSALTEGVLWLLHN